MTSTVTVKNVIVYPSDGKVAVGVDFVAKAPGRIFDVTGQVFLTAKPVTAKDGTIIRLTDVAFSRHVDNALWSVAAVIFEGQIKPLIVEKAQIDLAPEIAKQIADVKAKLTDPKKTGGIKITIRDAKAGVEQIVTEADDLAALIRLDVGIDTQLQEIAPLKQAATLDQR